MNSIPEAQDGVGDRLGLCPTNLHIRKRADAAPQELGETAELVVRLPDPWQEASHRAGPGDSGFRLLRYRGPLPNRAMLGEYALSILVDGPIRSIVDGITRDIPTGITTYLARSCLLDQIRALLDAGRSWAPGALYRLSLCGTRSGSACLIEVEASPDLEGRAFLPRELLERENEPHPGPRPTRSPLFTSGFSTPEAASRVETSIQGSGAWSVRLRIDPDARER